jgi:hypothetical protein
LTTTALFVPPFLYTRLIVINVRSLDLRRQPNSELNQSNHSNRSSQQRKNPLRRKLKNRFRFFFPQQAQIGARVRSLSLAPSTALVLHHPHSLLRSKSPLEMPRPYLSTMPDTITDDEDLVHFDSTQYRPQQFARDSYNVRSFQILSVFSGLGGVLNHQLYIRTVSWDMCTHARRTFARALAFLAFCLSIFPCSLVFIQFDSSIVFYTWAFLLTILHMLFRTLLYGVFLLVIASSR